MKNLLLMGILVANCTFTLAQSTARTEEYCEFTLAGALGSGGRCSIRLDTGRAPSPWPTLIDKLRDENGEVILFNSAVDALNYLNGYGWELFAIHGDSSAAHYVMRRKIGKQTDQLVPNQRGE